MERDQPIQMDQLDTDFQPTCLYQLMQVYKQCRKSGMIGEIIRASPEDSIIQIGDIQHQVGHYILGGVIAISVNTEPNWFAGDIDDIRKVREVINAQGAPVVIIQRDFIFTTYQILEGLQAKSDTFFLIIPLLKLIWEDVHQLIERTKALLVFARNHGIEPIFEISCETELEIVKQMGARIIQIGFTDNYTSDYLTSQVPINIEVIVSCSSISKLNTVQSESYFYTVGKDLMLATNPSRLISIYKDHTPKVKVCGISDLSTVIKLGSLSDIMMMGFVFTKESYQSKCRFVQRIRRYLGPKQRDVNYDTFSKYLQSHESTIYQLQETRRIQSFPLLVGVFFSETSDNIRQTVSLCQLDLVQLEGDTTYHSSIHNLGIPTIRVIDISHQNITSEVLNTLLIQYQREGDIVMFRSGVDLNSDKRVDDFPYQKLNYAKTYTYPCIDIGVYQHNLHDIIKNIHPWLINVDLSNISGEGTSLSTPGQNIKLVQHVLKVLSVKGR
jgi:indole-3-glycerol phosphate synthase/phosphoribosylanthranilate isomerase